MLKRDGLVVDDSGQLPARTVSWRTNFRSQLIAAYDRGPQPVTETKSNW